MPELGGVRNSVDQTGAAPRAEKRRQEKAAKKESRRANRNEGFPFWYHNFQHSEVLPGMPPNAELSPDSEVPPENRGKVPAKFLAHDVKKPDGTILRAGWVGFSKWPEFQATLDDIKQWHKWGANVCLQTRIFHAIDADVDDQRLAAAIEHEAKRIFGAAPVRDRDDTPRWLMLTHIADGELPLRKRRLAFLIDGKKNAVELLAKGSQCVVEGANQKGQYRWRDGHPCICGPQGLPEITKAKADEFFAAVADLLELFGYEVISDNKGSATTPGTRRPIGAPELMAPSPQHVLDILKACSNADNNYDEFIALLPSIKASLGEAAEDFYSQVEDFALTYEENTPEFVRAKWDNIHDAALGWSYLEAWARSKGYSTAQADFDDGNTAAAHDPENPDGTIPENPIDRMLGRNIYVKKQDKYYDHEEGTWMSGKGFNAVNTAVARYGRTGIQSAEAEFQNNPKARKVATTTYQPGEPIITKEKNEQGIAISAVNQWRPSPIVPAKNATDDDVRPWLTLVNLIFGEATAEREHFLNWAAHTTAGKKNRTRNRPNRRSGRRQRHGA